MATSEAEALNLNDMSIEDEETDQGSQAGGVAEVHRGESSPPGPPIQGGEENENDPNGGPAVASEGATPVYFRVAGSGQQQEASASTSKGAGAEDDGGADDGGADDGGAAGRPLTEQEKLFGINWRTRVNANPCCRDTEHILKPLYTEHGGTQGQLGDAGLDGQGTTLSMHGLLDDLEMAGALKKGGGTTVTDLGSGLGTALMHFGHFTEGVCVGIELSDLRVDIALVGLHKMTEAVRCNRFPLIRLSVLHPLSAS